MDGPKTVLCDTSSVVVIAELPVDNATSAASDEEYLYLLDSSGKVTTYNLKDGKLSGKPDIKITDSQSRDGIASVGARMMVGGLGGNVLARSSDGGLFTALEGNLLYADPKSGVDVVLESTAYSLGTPGYNVNTLLILGDGSIVVNLSDGMQSSRLFRYTWDENASVNPDKVLTVWSLEDNSFIRAAIAQLRIKHPDAYIMYEVALDGKSAVSASDAIKTLNTRLIAGNGPDVILLDGCSVDNYVEKGMLLDLYELIDTGEVFSSIIDPYKSDGKIYCLPAQFLMPILMGSADALEKARTFDEIVALVVNGNDRPGMPGPGSGPFMYTGADEGQRSALSFTDLKELCDILWISCAPEIVKNNRLDIDALRSYLSAVRAISDKYGLMEETQAGPGMAVGFSDGGNVSVLPGSLIWYTMQMTDYAAFSAGNLQLLQMMMDRADSTLTLFPGLTPGAWQPSTVVGVSADTHSPEFAAELIQAMLSVEVQQLNYGTGLPVTRNGLSAQIDRINERLSQFGIGVFSFDAEALIGMLQSPSMGDTVLTGMMWNTVVKCCKGELDVEGAVKEIEQNVKNYLAERA